MKFQIEIIVDGNSYKSVILELPKTLEEVTEEIYSNFGNLIQFKLNIINDGYLILGKEAIQRAQIIVREISLQKNS